MTSIVTKTGDKGDTGLFGGHRTAKDSPRLQAYGTVDELNANLGVALAENPPAEIAGHLDRLQHLLFRAGADLATPAESPLRTHRMRDEDITMLEGWVDALEAILPPQQAFILPGGTKASAALHVCRTVCRRAEREIVTLSRLEPLEPNVIIFFNRLGDYLFLAARQCNTATGHPDTIVRYE
jgi:cob(I)alamin adenosyltransferase